MCNPYPATVAEALREGRVDCLRLEGTGFRINSVVPIAGYPYGYVITLDTGDVMAVDATGPPQSVKVHSITASPAGKLLLIEQPKPPGYFQSQLEQVARELTKLVEAHRAINSPVRKEG